MRMPIYDIKWHGIYDKYSNKLCAVIHAQLLTESTCEQKHNERNEGQIAKHRKLQDDASYV